MDLRQLQDDKELRRDGVWVTLFPGVRWKLRPISHPAYQRAVGALRKRFSRELKVLEEAIAEGTATEAEIERHEEIITPIIAKAASIALVTDWDGPTEDGGPVPFSPAKVEEYMLGSRIIRDKVGTGAADEANYSRRAREEAEGNSAPVSGGSSPATARRTKCSETAEA